MANPTLLISPIAENGDKNVIPATTGATTGLLDQEHGFQQINELPLQAGGLPPQRKDFNGAFNLLSKILFYAQKGYIFEFDENQDYYAGCVVKDTDGGLYCANTDVSVSSTHPKDDPTNWFAINRGINTRDVINTSGTYTAPVSGWYKITAKGGGGGGRGSGGLSSDGKTCWGGAGGGEGGTTIAYVQMQAGDSASVVIGAGGNGSANFNNAGDGGNTTVTYDGTTYTAGGGIGGGALDNSSAGGSGTIVGCPGGAEGQGYSSNASGGAGGGAGGGAPYRFATRANNNGTNGGGGAGGVYYLGQGASAGGNGGNGFVWFEYFA